MVSESFECVTPSRTVSLLLIAGLLFASCASNATPAACAVSGMEPTLTALGGQVSEEIWQLALDNRSSSTCILEGFLYVQVQDARHSNILVAEAGSAANQRLILVRPGMTVYTKLHFPYRNPDTEESCKPAAVWLRIGMPDDQGQFDIPVTQSPDTDPSRTTSFTPCGLVIADAISPNRVG